MSLDRQLVLFAPEPESRAILSLRLPDVSVCVQLEPNKIDELKHLFVEVSASLLPRVTEIVKAANETKYLRALFIREDVDAKLFPQILQRADLRLMRNMLVHSKNDWTTPERVLNAWRMGSEDDLIATAAVFGDQLDVLTCALERLEVPFDKIPALKALPVERRSNFEIDEVGSFIHWPEQDVHIDVDVVRYAIDDKWRVKCDLERLSHNRDFGKAIASLRKEYNLRQHDIESLTDRQVRRIESGVARPSVATLRILAKAHHLPFDNYLKKLGSALSQVGQDSRGST